MIKTFRGLLADAGQDRIRLQTIKGKVGYRIVKFEIIAYQPFFKDQEDIVKIYKSEQSTVTDEVDFTDSNLLAVAIMTNDNTPAAAFMFEQHVIFDSEIFNQDIYVTHRDQDSGEPCNYYIELEVIPLDDAGAEYTTLKDLRST